MDSTILNRVGKRLEPDDKLKKSSSMLNELFSSEEFKKDFRDKLEKSLQTRKRESVYYQKYTKPDLRQAIVPLEQSLILKPHTEENSSLIQEKATALEFQLKKMQITNKTSHRHNKTPK